MTNHFSESRVREDDLRRTAAVAADYTQLQGLITPTTGAGLIVWGAGSTTWGGVVVAVGVVVWLVYYERRYGKVTARGSRVLSISLVFVALLVCLAGYTADGLLRWPVLLLPLIGAACLVGSFRLSYQHVGVTMWHWAAVGFLVLSSVTPLLGLSVLGAGTGAAAIGIALVVIGLIDHVRLVRSMKPIPRD